MGAPTSPAPRARTSTGLVIRDMPPPGDFDRLLGLCARVEPTAAQDEALESEVRAYGDWPTLADRAESHGVSPLVHRHLTRHAAHVPRDVSVAFAGLAARHRRVNAIRTRALGEIVTAFDRASVPLLLLKGAALAFQVFPEPGLRAMRDIDLLVRARDLVRAGALLRDMGYAAKDETSWENLRRADYDAPERTRIIDGASLSIEVHRRVPVDRFRARRFLEQLSDAKVEVDVGGVRAWTLGPIDMLVHVHHHGFAFPLNVGKRMRLTSAADLVTLVEAWVDRLDWKTLRSKHPRLVQSLAWLDVVTPWSDRARRAIGPICDRIAAAPVPPRRRPRLPRLAPRACTRELPRAGAARARHRLSTRVVAAGTARRGAWPTRAFRVLDAARLGSRPFRVVSWPLCAPRALG